VASLVARPFGALVHIRRKTVRWDLVRYLCIGSVPAAFAGVFVLKALGNGKQLENGVKIGLGIALLVASATIVVKGLFQLRQWGRDRRLERAGIAPPPPRVLPLKPVPTMLIGVGGGLVVGMTSVGSGSLIIVLLLLLYPSLQASRLVGTDLVQAVPLVAAASLGHLLFGDFKLGLTTSLVLGNIPGVYLGAKVSTKAPAGLVRRALLLVLVASGLKLLNVSTLDLAWILGVGAIAGPFLWMAARRANGLSARPPRLSEFVSAQ